MHICVLGTSARPQGYSSAASRSRCCRSSHSATVQAVVGQKVFSAESAVVSSWGQQFFQFLDPGAASNTSVPPEPAIPWNMTMMPLSIANEYREPLTGRLIGCIQPRPVNPMSFSATLLRGFLHSWRPKLSQFWFLPRVPRLVCVLFLRHLKMVPLSFAIAAIAVAAAAHFYGSNCKLLIRFAKQGPATSAQLWPWSELWLVVHGSVKQ